MRCLILGMFLSLHKSLRVLLLPFCLALPVLAFPFFFSSAAHAAGEESGEGKSLFESEADAEFVLRFPFRVQRPQGQSEIVLKGSGGVYRVAVSSSAITLT